MTKLFTVEVTVNFVIAADDQKHAESLACQNLHTAVRDDSLDDYYVYGEIKSEAGLPPGWDIACIPYGDADDKTIGTILAEQPPVVTPDTKTADMFTGAA